MQKTLDEAATAPLRRNPGSSWDDNLPVDQTPPPDHDDFERVAAPGRRAIKERRARRASPRQSGEKSDTCSDLSE